MISIPPAPSRSARTPPGEANVAPSRRFGREVVLAAVGALEAGVPAPLVCRRFGVSDRTLYRWRRSLALARGEGSAARPPARDAAALACHDAVRALAELIPPGARARAVRALEVRLRVSRNAARRLLGLRPSGGT
jgi:transposase-like protein